MKHQTKDNSHRSIDVARCAKALAHPARIAILKHLAQADICDCAHIVHGMPLAQSTVSQHRKVLKEAGLIEVEADGARSCYHLNREAFKRHVGLLSSFLASLPGIHTSAPHHSHGGSVKEAEDLKVLVKMKYGQIAQASAQGGTSSCCGSGSTCCGSGDSATFSEDYSHLEGYTPEADLGLGCGIPTQFARIEEGNTVIDLGSGAGNDVFVARRLAGASGKVIGVDMTEAMIDKARQNNKKLGYTNVEFRFGDIENLPVGDNEADVIVSNCVLNLVPDKQRAFTEVFRVLKPGGHFAISDIVLEGKLPDALVHDAELYAGCVAGALQKEEYLAIVRQAGFTDVDVVAEKAVVIPEVILSNYLTPQEEERMQVSGMGIRSVTVTASKPTQTGRPHRPARR